ncbi:MAG: mannosyltransferase OCH1 related protein [Rhodobacteraceae bacterium HLUCCA12]|nr:MAG: mannosyltransferase OCH1 related protein [Rhodobacteraceae bacterium HLUCCA12]
MDLLAGLQKTLWQAPLADPADPARTLAARLPEQGYEPVLTALRLLARCGLPIEPALAPALARWPWSIDLALVAAEADPTDEALARLRARCAAQNRRRAAAAWAYWRAGRASAARDALAEIDMRTPTAAADLACRAELALLDGDTGAAEADLARLRQWPGLHRRLTLQAVHARDGAAGLAAHVDAAPLALTELWHRAFDLLLQERDFARARALLDQARTHHGPDATRDAAIRLALACDDPDTALSLLSPGLTADPWHWDARDHAHWLRILLGQARLATDPDSLHRKARAHADAALRLHARAEALRGLWLTCRSLCDDWSALARALPGLPGAAPALNRLGLHDAAAAQLEAELQRTEGANPRARRLLALADCQLLQGAPDRAGAALDAAEALTPPAPTRVDLALLRAEIALWRFDPDAADRALESVQRLAPQRMGLWLALARAAFLRGDFDRAEDALATFGRLKTDQTGTPPPDDLRDRLVRDAARTTHGWPPGFARQPVDVIVARMGAARIADSPGLSACLLARDPPAFVPVSDAAIPRRIALYWDGPASGAVNRSVAAWRRLMPGHALQLFDADTARAWLARHHPGLVDLFARQTLPATRADLFRIAWIVTEGGIYADVDEYPRAAIDDWLEGARAVLCLECGHGTVANNFLAAEPGYPVLANALDRIAARLRACDAPYPWWDSGPAQLTGAVFAVTRGGAAPGADTGLRLLDQAGYCRRISTNLAFPHKRGPLHWR